MVTMLFGDMGRVDSDLRCSTVCLNCLLDFAWVDENLAGLAGHLGNMMEHPNQSQPNPTHVTHHHCHPVFGIKIVGKAGLCTLQVTSPTYRPLALSYTRKLTFIVAV